MRLTQLGKEILNGVRHVGFKMFFFLFVLNASNFLGGQTLFTTGCFYAKLLEQTHSLPLTIFFFPTFSLTVIIRLLLRER